ncbi:GDP-mannose 4,6-dehydratase [Candidatus Pelagibacter sp. HIMB1517]|uniref:GDP-mannose 4,6-dehydratase n=1 Tax=Candidatus Pelagibacter sp. HIMB1517 TaxID=3413341 RepID=UPI003F872AC3
MSKKTALITGISGQDGAYLADFLLKKKYKVIGCDRRSARNNNWRLIRLGIQDKIIFEEMELGEILQIQRVIKKYKISEIYNLGAQSFVATSFNSPIYTADITGLGALRILDTIRTTNPKVKFYQASSSEMYGDVLENNQNEKTPFNPRSPYAIAKACAHYFVKNYRDSYNLFAVSGILFNHESPFRGEEFVTRKITLGLTKIIHGDQDCIELGNLYAKRDWGYAKEYVELMWKMMQQKKAEDYVISTGKSYSIKSFINECVKYLKLKTKWVGKGVNEKLVNTKNNKILIKINKKFFRPAEVNFLKGDHKKAKKHLNWKPKTNLKKLVKIMMDEEIAYYSPLNK